VTILLAVGGYLFVGVVFYSTYLTGSLTTWSKRDDKIISGIVMLMAWPLLFCFKVCLDFIGKEALQKMAEEYQESKKT